ncbi:MAG: MurR/RpiR family transcriptional regulator [Desulfobacter sp.]|nr:MurR/RpiR family transcriptional regulator [Desulfobacter sp.]WDP85886.1 MAG: MurR/RpiR family transcriptional regulator [Desulfobacter sp.]
MKKTEPNEKISVIDKIASLMKGFSPANHKIACFVIKNKHDIGFASVTTLSDQAKVSKASIVRFAQALGFEGFNQFKQAIQRELKQQLSPYSNILFNDLDMMSKEKQLKKLVANEITNLNKTLNSLNVTMVMKIVAHMGAAGKIFVSGFGGSGPVARKFIHSLKIITDKRIEQVTGAVSDFSPALSSLAKGDVVFILTLPTYSAENFQLAEYVKNQGGILCLLTESPECPLYDMADAVLLCESNSLTLANSYVAITAVTQVITDMFFLYCKEEGIRSVKAIRNMEQ